MIKKILLNKKLPFKKRTRNVLAYILKRRAARLGWRKRFKKVFELHPDYGKSAEKRLERKHQDYWSHFTGKTNFNTFRVCTNISGVADPTYVPEEVYVADIEPTLNQWSEVEFLTNKSFYEWLFPDALFPNSFYHNLDGVWFDQNLSRTTFDEIKDITKNRIKFPVVFKPSKDSYGGSGVFFPKSSEELSLLISDQKDFVVQEKIEQHPFFNKFNHAGLNTIRVCLYRSVKDDIIHVINCSLRMGVGGSLDNETAGGIVCYINSEGELNGMSRDKYGQNHKFHPDTKHKFVGKIPGYEELTNSACTIASKIHYAKLTSLDYCLDINEVWRPIEINIFGQTIRFAQYAGQPFFGEFTDEVVEYCKLNHWALK